MRKVKKFLQARFLNQEISGHKDISKLKQKHQFPSFNPKYEQNIKVSGSSAPSFSHVWDTAQSKGGDQNIKKTLKPLMLLFQF